MNASDVLDDNVSVDEPPQQGYDLSDREAARIIYWVWRYKLCIQDRGIHPAVYSEVLSVIYRCAARYRPERGATFMSYAVKSVYWTFVRLRREYAEAMNEAEPFTENEYVPLGKADLVYTAVEENDELGLMWKYISELTEKQRWLLLAYFGLDGDGRTYTLAELGKLMKLSREQVRKRLLAIMDDIREAMRLHETRLEVQRFCRLPLALRANIGAWVQDSLPVSRWASDGEAMYLRRAKQAAREADERDAQIRDIEMRMQEATSRLGRRRLQAQLNQLLAS